MKTTLVPIFKTLSIMFAILVVTATTAFAETIVVGIEGMTCSSCANSITSALKKTEKVEDVKIDLDKKEGVVTLKDDAELSDDQLRTVITEAGYTVGSIERKE